MKQRSKLCKISQSRSTELHQRRRCSTQGGKET